MNHRKSLAIHQKVQNVINGGDLLLIVPPFTTNSSAIGPHLLQAVAREKGYQADVLYANLLLASIVGLSFSENVGTSERFQYWNMLHERLFARSAYGLPALGRFPEFCGSEALSISGNREQHRKVDYETEKVDLEELQEVEIVCTTFVDELVRILAALPYPIIGCTARVGQTNCSVALLNGIKKLRPDAISIVGGANCQSEMAEGVASLSRSIDYVFSGEGESAFGEFLDAYARRQMPSERIVYEKLVDDLDSLPELDYTSYFKQFKEFLGKDVSEVPHVWNETSRGCWWGQKQKCRFCGRNNESLTFRQKSPQRVLKELHGIKHSYPNVVVAMADNMMPLSYYKDLLPALAARPEDYPPIGLYYARANGKLSDLLALKRAKVTGMIPGIEALSTDLLKLLNKGVTAHENLLLLRNARSVGLHLLWFMLWGIPGDRIAYYKETLDLLPLIRHLQPPTKLFCVHLERNSVYVDRPEEYGITNLRPWAVYDAIYPEWADKEKLSFWFSADYPCESHDHPEMIRELADKLVQWRAAWKQARLLMMPFADYYIVYDSRESGKEKHHIVEAAQAKAMMTYTRFTNTEHQQWALQEKLGVVLDAWYVPLVTASAEVLIELQELHVSRN